MRRIFISQYTALSHKCHEYVTIRPTIFANSATDSRAQKRATRVTPGAARGRFAPTPSGPLHLGNAAAALLSWLQIRRAGGRFVLRIEDIDRPRARPQWAAQIIEDLRWLGIDWDEGPDIGGPHAPYRQSERSGLYADALQRLERAGRLYPCFCSRAELFAIAGAPHGLAAEGPAYPGTCRSLPDEERARRAARKPPSWRFALPDEPIRFCDGVAGPQCLSPGHGGDFVVRRADGVFAYQLAVVVDDAAMRITDVLRGADLLDSTARQLSLFAAFEWPAPRYCHIPLILGPDGRRLAKRDRSAAIAGMRAAGAAPEEVVGCLAHLCGLRDRAEPAKPGDLVDAFSTGAMPRHPVTVSAGALERLSGR